MYQKYLQNYCIKKEKSWSGGNSSGDLPQTNNLKQFIMSQFKIANKANKELISYLNPDQCWGAGKNS